MQTEPQKHMKVPFIRGLLSDQSEEKIREAEENLTRYMKIALRVFEREEELSETAETLTDQRE